MQCFTAVERLNPENDDWRPAVNPSSILLHSLMHKHAPKDYRTYTPPMHEGYGLFIEEGRPDTSFGPELIASVVWFLVTVIRALSNQKKEPDMVPLALNAVDWDLALWASYCLVAWRFRMKSTLLITVAKILILWHHFHDKDTILDCSGSTFILLILISGVRYPTVLWQLAKYSIRIDWKEVRSLFR